MRILVTGAAGQIGREVVERFGDSHNEVVATDRDALDCGDRDDVFQCVHGTTPDAIVHCAGYTAVDDCEDNVELAYRDNALAVRHLGQAARRVGAHLLTISTDYVFDGTKPEPYHEWDTPAPQSVYGRSKLGGEHEAFASGADVTVLRVSWVNGRHGSNIVKTVLRLAAQHDRLTFVDDQVGHPTFADDLARMIHRFVVERRPGLFHVTNQGAVSWYEFVREVLAAAGHDPERVEPIKTIDLHPPRPAPRPANSVLDNLALRASGIELLPDFREALARCVRALTA